VPTGHPDAAAARDARRRGPASMSERYAAAAGDEVTLRLREGEGTSSRSTRAATRGRRSPSG
jgi:hypothetical protein